jgi:hypothetical protein
LSTKAISEKRSTHFTHSLSFLNHQQCSRLCLRINNSFIKKKKKLRIDKEIRQQFQLTQTN